MNQSNSLPPTGGRRRYLLPAATVALLVLFVAGLTYGLTHTSQSLAGQGGPSSLSGNGIAAPEFTGIVAWENSQPLTLQALRGKVVLVDF